MPNIVKAKSIFLIFGLFILVCCGKLAHAQTGCALIGKKSPPQYISFERMEEVSSPPKGESRERVVLRLRNNSTCDITIQLHGSEVPHALAMDKLPDGKIRLRIASAEFPSEFPDGARLNDLKYEVEYREPMPPAKKRYFQVDDVVSPFLLLSSRSVLFSVPLSLFNKWIHVEVWFDYEWDQVPKEVNYWRPPAHIIFFGNENLPDEIFRRTKSCRKANGCTPAQTNHRRTRKLKPKN